MKKLLVFLAASIVMTPVSMSLGATQGGINTSCITQVARIAGAEPCPAQEKVLSGKKRTLKKGFLAYCQARLSQGERSVGQFLAYCKSFLSRPKVIQGGVQVALSAGVFYALYNGYQSLFLPAADKKSEFLFGEVSEEVSLTPSITVKQVIVPRQEGNSCGYHAARNVALLVDSFVNCRDTQARLNDENAVAHLIGDENAPWRVLVNDCRKGKPTRLLDGDEIRSLFNDERDSLRLGLAIEGNPLEYVTIVESVNEPRFFDIESQRGIDYDAIQRKRRQACVRRVPFVHGFVLANMRQPVTPPKAGAEQHAGFLKQSLKEGSVGGHWIAAVLCQNLEGKTDYIVADSLGGSAALRSLPVRGLICSLEGPEVADRLR